MANKDLNIGIKVDSSQLDKTVQKVGELKQLSKGLSIQYDINGKPLDVVIDKSLNLQKQARLLTAELRRTKEGTAEFQLLSTRLGDVQDKLAATSAKSKDLFASLSLLPGPVGQFFGQLNGAIGLLKTFSSFSLKDVRFQLKQTVDDVKDITNGFLGINQAADDLNETNTTLVNNTNQANASLTQQASTAGAVAASIRNQQKETQLLTIATDAAGRKTIEAVKPIKDMTTAELRLFMVQRDRIVHNPELIDSMQAETAASKSATTATNQQTVATKNLTLAERAATFATNALKLALASLGIGLVIIAVTKLIEITSEWITGAKAAKAENERLSQSFETLKRSIDDTQQAIKDQTDLQVLQAKIAGKTESDIFKITKEGLDRRVQANKDARKSIERELILLQANTILSEEDKVKKTGELQDQLVKNSQQSNDLYLEGQKLVLSEELRIAEKNRQLRQKGIDDANKLREQQINDEKTASEMLNDLRNQNILKSIKDERERQLEELKIQAGAEVDKINALKISEEKKGELRNQVFLKYAKNTEELRRKFNDEDIKKTEETEQKKLEIINRLGEIVIQAINDQTEKEKAERNKKYRDDVSDLDKALKDKLISQTQYDTAVKNLQIALANDLKKIDDNAAKDENEKKLKKLDDELKFMQIRNEAMRQGTIVSFKAQRELLDKAQERELAQTDLTEAQKTAIIDKYTRLRQQSRQKEYETYLQYISQGLSAFSSIVSQQQQIVALQQQNELATLQNTVANKEELAEKEDKVKEKYFYKNRNAQYAQALINSFQSAISAYSSLAAIPVVGPALGAAAAAVALAFGLKQASLIKQQQYVSSFTMPSERAAQTKQTNQMNYMRNYADGGMIEGPRHSQGGVVVNAEGGEAIMTRGAVTMFKPLLSLMNQAGGGVGFQSNIMTTGFDNPKTKDTIVEDKPMIVKTYVVSNELTTEQQRQARLKDLSTL